jgi:hypothetical protein
MLKTGAIVLKLRSSALLVHLSPQLHLAISSNFLKAPDMNRLILT